jgi:CRP-like cAMP-binding protein
MTRLPSTGQEGTPGLLARGGLIGGGLPVRRPDLHFLYNVVETTPMMVGFASQLESSYDEWLKRALPALSDPLLAEATRRLQTMRFSAGETIIREGDLPDRFYIIAQGEVVVTHGGSTAISEQLGTLSAGQFFGEVGLLTGIPRTASVHAETAVEALALNRNAFLALVQNSAGTAEQLAEVVRCRLR